MAEALDVVGNLFNGKWSPAPEVAILSQRQLARLPLVEVTAVDPANSHEIDDAFAAVKTPNKSMEVSVVFARGGQIPFTSEQFQEAFENGWSDYPDHSTYVPMIKDEDLVTHELSLVEGGLRAGLELSFQLTARGITRNRKLRPVAVRTTQKTYWQYGEELVAGHHSEALTTVNLLRHFRGKWPLNPQRYIDYVGKFEDSEYTPEERLARHIIQEISIHANKEIGREADRYVPYPYRYTQQVDELQDVGIEPETQNAKKKCFLYSSLLQPPSKEA